MPECTKSTAWILNENMHKDKFMKYSKRKETEKKYKTMAIFWSFQ